MGYATDSGDDRLQRHRLSDRLLEGLTRMIAEGELASGDALPSVTTLAQRFGISTHIVREALAAMAARGLIKIEHGRGSFVEPLNQWRIVNSDIIALIGNRYPLPDLFEVRQTFEVGAARLAAQRRTEADLEELSRAVEQTASDRSKEKQVGADQAFHRALAQATHNPLFLPLLNAIIDPLCQYWTLSQTLPGIVDATYRGHLAIYGCVVDRDESGAAQAMEEHLRAGRMACQRLLDRSQSSKEESTGESN